MKDLAEFVQLMERKMALRESRYPTGTLPHDFMRVKLQEERKEVDDQIIGPNDQFDFLNNINIPRAQSELVDEAIMAYLIWKKLKDD